MNSSTFDNTPKTLDEMVEMMRKLQASMPPRSENPVAIIVGRGTLFDLEMLCEKRPWQGNYRTLPASTLMGLELRYDDEKPANWAEIEYADGHRERVYWFGQVKGQG